MVNIFDKEKYWKRRTNKVDKIGEDGKPILLRGGKPAQVDKPLRGQDIPSRIVGHEPSKATVGFTNEGKIVVQNRDYRRSVYRLPSTTPKVKKKRKKTPKTFGINKRKKK